MFRELDIESGKAKSFAGPLLEKVRKDLAAGGAEKPKVVLLPTIKRDRAPAAVETAQTSRIDTLPHRTLEPVKPLPTAAEREQKRGGGFGGSGADGTPQREKGPVMLPMVGAARDASSEGGLPKLQFSAREVLTLPLKGGTDTAHGGFGGSGYSQKKGFGTSTPEIYEGDINAIIHGIEIYQKDVAGGQAELEKLMARHNANPTQQTADAYNARFEKYSKDVAIYEKYFALYKKYYNPEEILQKQKEVEEELSGLKEKKREAMTDSFFKGAPIGNLLGATWSALRAGGEYDGQITDKEQEKKDLGDRYYAADNVQAQKALQSDPAAAKIYDKVVELQTDLDAAMRAAGETSEEYSGAELMRDREYLLRKYGITQDAINRFNTFGRSDTQKSTGAYTNLVHLIDGLTQKIDAEKKKLSGMKYRDNASYDYDRMAKYEQTVKDAEAAAKDVGESIQYAKDHPVLATIDTVLVSPFVVIDYLKTVIPAMINGDPDKLESYVPPKLYNMELSNHINAVRGTVAEGIKDMVGWKPAGDYLSTLYSNGMGMADLVTQTAAFGPTGALFLGSTRVAGDTARSMLERGSSGTEAFWGSMAVGAANMLIYEYGAGKLMELAGPVDTSTVEGMLGGAFKRAGVAATAGATGELSRILIDTAALGHSSEFDLDVKRLRAGGMGAEDARRQTFTDYMERVVNAGARSGRYGLITGLSEYGGEYFQQHPEALDALVSGKAGMGGNMPMLPGGGTGGGLGLPGGGLAPGGGAGAQGLPMLPGQAAVKDDWETAIKEAVDEGPGEAVGIDISGKSGIIIGKSVGAKGKNYDVFDPRNGKVYHFSEGQHLQDVETFAGYGTRVPLHEGVAEGLTERFGGDVTKWQHVKGVGYLDVDGEDVFAEIHWFQNAGTGKVLLKVKGRLSK